MPKKTLLEMVQDILSDMDSDEVNSITDTVESQQVAQKVQTTYFQIIDGKDWPNLFQLFPLDNVSEVNRPNYLKLPENIMDIKWLKYNTKKELTDKDKFEEIKYLSPDKFIYLCNQRDSTDIINNRVIQDYSGVTYTIQILKAPQYYTSFDDEYIVFDSVDTNIDTTLVGSKTQAYGKKHPSFIMSDEFIPNLPVQAFSLLLAESKASCFFDLRQTPNGKAEQQASTQRRRQSQEKWRTNGGIKYPDYGRRK